MDFFKREHNNTNKHLSRTRKKWAKERRRKKQLYIYFKLCFWLMTFFCNFSIICCCYCYYCLRWWLEKLMQMLFMLSSRLYCYFSAASFAYSFGFFSHLRIRCCLLDDRKNPKKSFKIRWISAFCVQFSNSFFYRQPGKKVMLYPNCSMQAACTNHVEYMDVFYLVEWKNLTEMPKMSTVFQKNKHQQYFGRDKKNKCFHLKY